MKLLQINVTANWGSHGKIAESIGQLAMANGWESAIAYGRMKNDSQSELKKIGTEKEVTIHGIATRLLDYHGLMSSQATKKFVHWASKFSPDIIHLHNIHGYYINYQILFDFLKKWGRPVVWTLHDCWPFTGHCAYYTFNGCSKWQDICTKCPGLNTYPKSLWDGSKRNYFLKKKSFLGMDNLTLVPVSNWLKSELKKSILKDYPSTVIHNGIDTNVFRPSTNIDHVKQKYKFENKKILLGVASIWEKRKGLDEFVKLRKLLPNNYQIILVGLTCNQISVLPDGITGINRTNDTQELVDLYTAADLFLNPTLEDNFPTTNLEALSCGTPIITYNTGGSPEAIDSKTGMVIDYKDISSFAQGIVDSIENNLFSPTDCRERALALFNKDICFQSYLNLYEKILH